MAVASRRALHFVFKVADRTSTASFYRQILGMKVRKTLSRYFTACTVAKHRSCVTRNSRRAAKLLAMGESSLVVLTASRKTVYTYSGV